VSRTRAFRKIADELDTRSGWRGPVGVMGMDGPPRFAPGMTLGTYRLERLLGRGGMGAVFLAYDTRLHRQVALKVIDGDTEQTTSSIRLLREARNAAALNHPHICTIHEVGEIGDTTFIAMEHVSGRSLRERIDEGALPTGDAVHCGIQAADALAYAHEHGVVHRDFKAANVIVDQNGWLTVVDFGMARRTDAGLAEATTLASLVPAGTVAGTPYAMAPEQVQGETADARTDVWALGVLLYEMVTGARPFSGQTVPDLLSSILTKVPATLPSTVPAELRVVIERCLEKDPARRYQRAGDVRTELNAIAAGTVAPWATWGYHLRRRPLVASAGALGALALVLLGLDVGGVRHRLVGVPPDERPTRLAVLPFQNLTGDPDQEYFSDGLTDEMIFQLRRLQPRRLSVIARTSSMRYKNRDTPLAEIGRELGVEYVLEGSVRREGHRVRINTTLIDARDETHLWTESFERELAGILGLQNDVTRSVAGSLRLTLLPAEQTRLAGARPVTPEAYEAYLRGMFHMQRRTRPDLDLAQQYFEVAVQHDPDYAPAHAGIAGVWNSRNFTGYVPPSEAAPRAKAAALRALELDGALAHAHRARAVVAWAEFDWETTDLEYRRAIELDPNDAIARGGYAQVLMALRRPEEAIAHAERALQLDPLSPNRQQSFGSALYYALAYLQRDGQT
jgi:serine/threonine protein kinase